MKDLNRNPRLQPSSPPSRNFNRLILSTHEAFQDRASSVMESQQAQSQLQSSSSVRSPITTSCRKKKSEEASFLADVKDHIDEFVHASMDEHKTCFKKTIQKMFGMSKVVAERNSSLNEAESSLPLQTMVSEK
ncbi:uncharacterized protein LOC131221255 isoform X2 [Magnolia sinica]|uniref:uncharacterized protein LOC131221255 isoform X2 n=1 Tax=Magnolia sinica TaxID=86752 RepID=UPI00265B3C91|nr:uncharacterized protein LOC131221255 isoform X2 [Magnolia sinica]